MSFLQLEGKTFLVFGVANKKSVAFHVGRTLQEAGAKVLYSVRSQARKEQLSKKLPEENIFICDVEHEGAIQKLADEVSGVCDGLDGIVHSIAFANYSEGLKPFHETKREDFLQATQISSFSLINLI